jgi:hypothetical protein
MPATVLNASQVANILKQIAINTGAEVVFKGMCFEMHGLEHEVRAAVNTVSELDIVKVRSRIHPLVFASPSVVSTRPSTTRFDSR